MDECNPLSSSSFFIMRVSETNSMTGYRSPFWCNKVRSSEAL
jgi:hypothetical protein